MEEQVTLYPRAYEFKGNRSFPETIYAPLTSFAKYFEYTRASATGLTSTPIESPLKNYRDHLDGSSFIAVKAQEIQILGNINLKDELKVDCAISRVGDSSFTISQKLHNKSGQLIATAAITMVNISFSNGKSTSIPNLWKGWVEKQKLRPYDNPMPSPVDFLGSCVNFSKNSSKPKILEIFSHDFNIYQSHIDLLNHTNNTVIIQFYEDTMFLAKNGFSHPYNQKMANTHPRAIKVEYTSQSYAGQKIRVILWPLFKEDFTGKNFSKYGEEQLIKEWEAFGGEIRITDTSELVSRAILFLNKNTDSAKL